MDRLCLCSILHSAPVKTSVVPATFSIGAMVTGTIGKEAKQYVNSLDITLFLLRVVRSGTS